MSTVVMSQCWPLDGMSPTQKAVLISLADQANDEGYCWPSVRTVARRTCLCERAVQGAIRWLEKAGFLQARERHGTSSMYQINVGPASAQPPQQMHPRSKCTPAANAPRGADAAPPPPQMLHPTPADAAPKPSMNRQLNRKEPKDRREAAPNFVLPGWINRRHWDAWHSCQKRKAATTEQKQMAVEKLDAWRRDGVDHAAALENAALAGWQGLFKPPVQSAHVGTASRLDGETVYQRSMRLRMEEAAPGSARKAPGSANSSAVIDVTSIEVGGTS